MKAQDQFFACAPEIPGSAPTGHEMRATRDEAIERCRSFAKTEVAAYERLGMPLGIAPEEEIVEWTAPWWLIPEWLMPIRPSELRTAIARMDDLAAQVERSVTGLTRAELDRRVGPEWSVATVLDHVSHGFGLAPIQMEPIPLEPAATLAATMRELADALGACVGSTYAVTHFGLNAEGARIRWTPRKVARAVRTLQQAWSRYAAEGGAQPRPPFGHDDRAEDDEPLTAADVDEIVEADGALHGAAERDRTVSRVAGWYRYYRSRLARWPEDELMRWRAMYAAFHEWFVSATETDLALVRLAPFGVPATVRGELRLGIGHVAGHLDQIRAAATVPSIA